MILNVSYFRQPSKYSNQEDYLLEKRKNKKKKHGYIGTNLQRKSMPF